jgi:hypothetical protein
VNVDNIFNLLAAVVGVAMVTTIVAHPQSTALVKASGQAFSGILKTATGQ